MLLHRRVGGLALARSLAVLARVLGYASHHDEAIDAAREALALAPGDDQVVGWARLAEADASHAVGRFEDGLASATSSAASFERIDADVDHGYALYSAAVCLDALGRHEEAAGALEQGRALLRRRPIRSAARSMLGALQSDSLLAQEYRLLGRVDDALKVGREAREFVDVLARLVPRTGRPVRATLLSRLGACHEQVGDATAAVADYELAIGEAMKLVARSHQSMIWDRTRHVLRLRSALREYFPPH